MAAGPAFLFHVGPHKTGTTYLQEQFRAARDALAARGILVPLQWTDGPGPGHAMLPARLRAGNRSGLAADFTAVLDAGAQTVLVSAEDLCALEKTALEALRGLLAGRPARFVFYVRRWSELLPSIWQERVKHGLDATLPEYLVVGLRNPAEWPPANFGLRLGNIADVFGMESVHIVSYSELRDRGMDMFSHFAEHFLHWPGAQPDSAMGVVNATRDLASIEILRMMNSLSRRHGRFRKDRLRAVFDRLPDRNWLAPVAAAIDGHTRTVRIGDRWPSLAALHESLFATYQDRLVAPKRPKMLFRGSVRDVAFADPVYLTVPGVAEILRTLHALLETAASRETGAG